MKELRKTQAMKFLYYLSMLMLVLASSCQGPPGPMEVVETVFAHDYVLDLEKHFVEGHDREGYPNGANIPKNIARRYLLLRPIWARDTTAVVSVHFSDSTDQTFDSFDAYVHLHKDSTWKISAYTHLVTLGYVEREHKWLKSLTQLEIDTEIERSKNDTTIYDLEFSSLEEYTFRLENTRLTISSDHDLIAYFNKNKSKFEKLKDDFLIHCAKKGNDINEIFNIKIPEGSMRTQMDELFIQDARPSSFITSDEDSFYNVKFEIGGWDRDNTVGYLHVGELWGVPDMSPDHFIMIRRIEGNWFLYKTN